MMNTHTFILIATLLILTHNEAILDGYPITFKIAGTTTFTPDAGGSQQNGYTINLGFTGRSWIAAQLYSITGNTDFLVVKNDDFYSVSSNAAVSGHLVTYGDYFKNASGLQSDSVNQNDISSYSYSKTKNYYLPITRNLLSNSGQDWNAGNNKYTILKVCFYTSSSTFNPVTYNQGVAACYNYEVNNLVSTFVGPYIKSMVLNGYNTSIYGFIDGPYVTAKVYLYQQTAQFAYVKVPAIAIQVGTTAGNYGQDFYVSSPISSENGDYYGSDVNHIAFDNSAGGYQNDGVKLNHWNADPNTPIASIGFTALRINFTRAIYTYDSYDKNLLSTFIFCVYLYSSGSISSSLSDKACQMVELSASYLSMSLPANSDAYLLLSILLCWLLIFQ